MKTLAAPDILNDRGESTQVPDLVVSGGLLGISDGLVALRERVTQRLRFWKGESYQDVEDGVPYVMDIFQQRPIPASLVSTILINQALKADEAESVTDVSYGLDPESRKFVWTATVTGRPGSVQVRMEV